MEGKRHCMTLVTIQATKPAFTEPRTHPASVDLDMGLLLFKPFSNSNLSLDKCCRTVHVCTDTIHNTQHYRTIWHNTMGYGMTDPRHYQQIY